MKLTGPFSIGSRIWPGISKLIEECGEAVQVCGKLLGSSGEINHWDGSNLKTRLEDELGDLLAAIDFVIDHCGLNSAYVLTRMQRKRERFEKWHEDELKKG